MRSITSFSNGNVQSQRPFVTASSVITEIPIRVMVMNDTTTNSTETSIQLQVAIVDLGGGFVPNTAEPIHWLKQFKISQPRTKSTFVVPKLETFHLDVSFKSINYTCVAGQTRTSSWIFNDSYATSKLIRTLQ